MNEPKFKIGDKVTVNGRITEVIPVEGSHDVVCSVKLEDGDMVKKHQTYLYSPEKVATDPIIKNDNNDNLNHPAHYTAGKVECIDALEAATVNLTGIEAVCTANAIKYLWRWKMKNGVQDLQKAKWYIERLIKNAD